MFDAVAVVVRLFVCLILIEGEKAISFTKMRKKVNLQFIIQAPRNTKENIL